MNDAEKKYEPILKKAIEKAINNGYEHRWLFPFSTPTLKGKIQQVYDDECCDREGAYGLDEDLARAFVLSHKFAKAFFGEQPIHVCGEGPHEGEIKHKYHCAYVAWAWHLQQMVFEENPIQYLEQFLRNDLA